MAAKTDTGHAVNLDNFSKLKNACALMDPPYLPVRDELKLPALTTLLANSSMAQKTLTEKRLAYSRKGADRSDLYQTLGPVTTQCLSILKSSGVLPQVLQGATSIANKVRGVDTRKKQKSQAEEPVTIETPQETGEAGTPPVNAELAAEEKRYSVSQMSCVMRAENFGKLLALLKMEPLYQPSNNQLKIPALETLHAQLLQFNEDVSNAFQVYKNALTARNQIFYTAGTGLVDIAFSVKDFVKGDYGINSEANKSVKGISFKRLKMGK
jgi:hypothetical protein